MTLKCSFSFLMMVVLSFGAVDILVDSQSASAQDVALTERLEQLEKRTQLLENLLFSSVKLETARARRALEDRQASLKHSKTLFAKGLINESLLQQDRYRVREAELELEIATNPYNQRQSGCQLNVINAKRKLKIAEDELAYQTLLASKGYVSQTRIGVMTRSVDEATQTLEYAEAKLRAAKQLDEVDADSIPRTISNHSKSVGNQEADQQEDEMVLPQPAPEMDIFKAEVGTWDVKIKSWAEPGEPALSEGTETNRMLGGFWLVSDFQGTMMGLEFEGHGVYGFDAEKKQYTGTWMDSLGPQKMDMVGEYVAATKTLTMEGVAPGPDGKPTPHVISTKTNDDGSRLMTMLVGGVKLFEMKYTQRAKDSK